MFFRSEAAGDTLMRFSGEVGPREVLSFSVVDLGGSSPFFLPDQQEVRVILRISNPFFLQSGR